MISQRLPVVLCSAKQSAWSSWAVPELAVLALLCWSRVKCKGHVQGMASCSVVVLQVCILPEAQAGIQGKRCGVGSLNVQVGALHAVALLLGDAEGLLQAQAGVGPACKQTWPSCSPTCTCKAHNAVQKADNRQQLQAWRALHAAKLRRSRLSQFLLQGPTFSRRLPMP